MNLISSLERAAVRAIIIKIAFSAVACLLFLALGSASVGAFMTIAAQYGPATAGGVLAGGLVLFAALIIIVTWIVIQFQSQRTQTEQADTHVNSTKPGSLVGGASDKSELVDQALRIAKQNPMATTGLALLAGIAVSSNPDLVRGIAAGLNEGKKKS